MKMDRQQIAGNWNSRGFSCPDKTMAKWEFWHCMREELFVVYSIVMPSRSASVMLALACGTGCLP